MKGWGAAAALLVGLAAGGSAMTETGQEAASGEPPTPLGNWVSENILFYDDLDLSAEFTEEELEELAQDEITTYAFLPDGTWVVHNEDPLGALCFNATWRWVADGDTLRVPGRADLRWHFSLNADRTLLILTSPVGSVGVFLAEGTPPDSTGCKPEPGMLPFW